jgi:2-methylcitrate dehydratase PrpD
MPGKGTGNQMAALTADLGDFVARLALNDIPAAASAVAKTGFTDCFGVMIAGARSRSWRSSIGR